MSRLAQPITSRQPTTARVQPLLIRLDGITAGDYLPWVRDPEPPARDLWLRSVVPSAQRVPDVFQSLAARLDEGDAALENVTRFLAAHPRTTALV